MANENKSNASAIFDLHAISANFPAAADTMNIDARLTDGTHASSRVVRTYAPVAAHYHATCDEYLVILSGRAKFFLKDEEPFEAGPGQLIFFKKGIVHGTPEILEEPFVVLAIDTPRRDPSDVHFVNPSDGTPETFLQSQRLY